MAAETPEPQPTPRETLLKLEAHFRAGDKLNTPQFLKDVYRIRELGQHENEKVDGLLTLLGRARKEIIGKSVLGVLEDAHKAADVPSIKRNIEALKMLKLAALPKVANLIGILTKAYNLDQPPAPVVTTIVDATPPARDDSPPAPATPRVAEAAPASPPPTTEPVAAPAASAPVTPAADQAATVGEALAKAINRTSPTAARAVEPATPPKETEADQFRKLADSLFGPSNGEHYRAVEAQRMDAVTLSAAGRVDTLANFQVAENSSFSDNPDQLVIKRNGLYRIIEAYFGGSLEAQTKAAGDRGERRVGEFTVGDVRDFAAAVEHFASSKDNFAALKEAYFGTFICGRKFMRSYTYRNETEPAALSDLGKLIANPEEETKGLFINLHGLVSDFPIFSKITDQEYFSNEFTTQMTREFRVFARSPLMGELRTLYQEIGAKIDPQAWQQQDLATLGDPVRLKLIEVFKKYPDDLANLGQALTSLGLLIDFTHLYQSMRPHWNEYTKTHWQETDQGVAISEARNPYSVLASIMYGGRKLSELPANTLRYSSIAYRNRFWPPYTSILGDPYIKGALSHERPISFGVTQDKPIAVFVGNNGAGKTHGMETFIQSLGVAQTVGLNFFADGVKSPKLAEIRALIGASQHGQRLSSFQSESTLLTAALANLSDKQKAELAVFAIDEVGKGTDSRDALALTVAVMEYCRRNNIHMVVATHHGKQLTELARKFELDHLIQIYAPNFDTHQLEKFDHVVDSYGIEVMSRRAQKDGVPAQLLDGIIKNALNLRAGVRQDVWTNFDRVPIPEQTKITPMGFVDAESLRDLGMYWERRSQDENIDFGVQPLADRFWKNKYYEYSPHAAYYKVAEAKWRESYGKGFNFGSNSEILPAIHQTVDDVVQLLSNPDTRSKIKELSANSAVLAAVLFTPANLDATSRAQFIDDLGKLEQDTDPFIDNNKFSPVVKQSTSFQYLLANPLKRAELFGQMRQLAEVLQSSPNKDLQLAAQRLKTITTMEARVVQVINETDQYKADVVRQAIYNKMASTVNSYNFVDSEVQEVSKLLDVPLADKRALVDYAVPRIKSGNLIAIGAIKQWAKGKQGSYSFSYSNLDSILFVEDTSRRLPHNFSTLRGFGVSFNEWAQAKGSRFTNIAENKIGEEIIAASDRGDFRLLTEVVDFLLENGVSPEDYSGAYKILALQSKLNHRRWLNFRDSIDTAQDATVETKVDYYQVLEVSPGSAESDIRRSYRSFARLYHPDINPSPEAAVKFKEYTDAYHALSDSQKRAAYDQQFTQKVMDGLAFSLTVANGVHDLGMTKPKFSTDGSFKVDGSVSVGLLSTMPLEKIARQSLEFKGDDDLIVIGGMNGGGKSQLLIQMASNLMWAKAAGYVPAREAILPQLDFVSSAVNAGESTEAKSSFQNEIDRYNDLLKRYIEAGSPRNGVIFLDEPLAGTSSEDQIGILVSMIDFFKSRGVKVMMTNHNFRFYEALKKTTPSTGGMIKFLPVAFGSDPNSKFKLSYFSPDKTSEIKSDGIKVAGEMGVPKEIIELAYYVRQKMAA